MEKKSKLSNTINAPKESIAITEKQASYLRLYKECGSLCEVAKKTGVHISTVKESLESAAAKLGYGNYKEMVPKEVSAKITATGASKKKVRKSKVSEIVDLVEAQGFRCAISGVELTPEQAVLDHKQALARGGSDDIENLQWLDKDVNRAKGIMTNEEFIAMCRRIVVWNS